MMARSKLCSTQRPDTLVRDRTLQPLTDPFATHRRSIHRVKGRLRAQLGGSLALVRFCLNPRHEANQSVQVRKVAKSCLVALTAEVGRRQTISRLVPYSAQGCSCRFFHLS